MSEYPKIDQCYTIEDNQQALDCLKEATKEESPCKSRLVLFTKKGCSGCKEERKANKADIEAGRIEEISLNSKEGRAIADKNGLVFVPALVVLDCHDNIIEPDAA